MVMTHGLTDSKVLARNGRLVFPFLNVARRPVVHGQAEKMFVRVRDWNRVSQSVSCSDERSDLHFVIDIWVRLEGRRCRAVCVCLPRRSFTDAPDTTRGGAAVMGIRACSSEAADCRDETCCPHWWRAGCWHKSRCNPNVGGKQHFDLLIGVSAGSTARRLAAASGAFARANGSSARVTHPAPPLQLHQYIERWLGARFHRTARLAFEQARSQRRASSTKSPMATPTRGESSPSQSRKTPKGRFWMEKSERGALADSTHERRSGRCVSLIMSGAPV